MIERSAGPPPPAYPLRVTYPQAVAWTISGLVEQPAMPGEIVARRDAPQVRRLVERYVRDREHREQLKAWCRAKASPKDRDQSFASICKARYWNERTAQRNVDRALGMVFMMLNWPGEVAA